MLSLSVNNVVAPRQPENLRSWRKVSGLTRKMTEYATTSSEVENTLRIIPGFILNDRTRIVLYGMLILLLISMTFAAAPVLGIRVTRTSLYVRLRGAAVPGDSGLLFTCGNPGCGNAVFTVTNLITHTVVTTSCQFTGKGLITSYDGGDLRTEIKLSFSGLVFSSTHPIADPAISITFYEDYSAAVGFLQFQGCGTTGTGPGPHGTNWQVVPSANGAIFVDFHFTFSYLND